MGRYSRWLHKGKRGSLYKLKKEIFNKNRKNNLENVCAEEKKEEKVIYCPSNLPEGVYYMEGILEIKPSLLKQYINEFYKNK